MNEVLKRISITNFRSIQGSIDLPLDASVVLVHGLNGVGKTSLVSAIELALTGQIASLQRGAKDSYTQHLHNVEAVEGQVELTLADKSVARATVTAAGVHNLVAAFDGRTAKLFAERCVLPQTLLGRFLDDSAVASDGNDSQLVSFAKEILHLDQLDALIAGLSAAGDTRNARRNSKKWTAAKTTGDILKNRLSAIDTDLASLRQSTETVRLAIDSLGPVPSPETERPGWEDLRIRLQSARNRASTLWESSETIQPSRQESDAAVDRFDAEWPTYEHEMTTYLDRASSIGLRLEPVVARDVMEQWRRVRNEVGESASNQRDQLEVRSLAHAQALALDAEIAALELDLETATTRRTQLLESGTLPELGRVLADLLPFVTSDVCPTCDQPFAASGTLHHHVSKKITQLDAEGLLLKAAADAQLEAERNLDAARARRKTVEMVSEKDLAKSRDRLQTTELLRASLDQLETSAAQMDVLARDRDAAVARLARVTTDGALRDSVMDELSRIEALLEIRPSKLSVFERFDAADQLVEALSNAHARKAEADRERARLGSQLESDLHREALLHDEQRSLGEQRHQLTTAIQLAESRKLGARDLLRSAESLRSTTIGQVFDHRLNGLWRQLFTRLAPEERFIPGFKIDQQGARAVGVKLVTGRDGVTFSDPSSVLSYGNANTAALTLFMSLHFSSPEAPRLLVLDDPVQSMDDVHVSNLAALLRRFAFEHERQIIIAVHERALFEYLRLELAPAQGDGSVLAITLDRDGANTTVRPERLTASTDAAVRSASVA